MGNLRVELDAVHAGVVRHRGDGRVLRIGDGAEAGWQRADAVPVAHPDRGLAVESIEERAGVVLVDDGEAVLAFSGGDDAAAELVREQLHAVADAEDGDAALEYPWLGQGRPVGVNGRGAAGEDDALQVEPGDGCAGRRGGDEFAVDVLLADAARYEPAVL